MNAVLQSLSLWVLAGLALVSATSALAGLLHERWDYEDEISQADGSTLKVRRSGSQRRYFGHPHVFGWTAGLGSSCRSINFQGGLPIRTSGSHMTMGGQNKGLWTSMKSSKDMTLTTCTFSGI